MGAFQSGHNENTTMKTIGIIGYYDANNFGDDLMALTVAKAIKDSGSTPLILSASHSASLNRYELVKCPDEFSRRCELIILGGGGALLHHSSPDPKAAANVYSQYLLRINGRAIKLGIPICATSIGGESDDIIRPLRAGITSILSNPYFMDATVRLRSDIETVRFFEKEAFYFPDILLATAKVFPMPDRAKSIAAIQCETVKDAVFLRNAVRKAGWSEVVFIHTGERIRQRMIESNSDLGKAEHFVARNVGDTLELLSRCGIVIGNRLHLGVVGMSYGARFMLLHPQPKAARFFSDLGIRPPVMKQSIWDRNPLSPADKESDRICAQGAAELSLGHIDYIRSKII